MSTNHSDKIILSLLDNDAFIQWVINPTTESDAFWQNQINRDEELKISAETLKNIIKKLKVVEPKLSQDDKMEIWKKIEQNTLHVKTSHRTFRKIWLRGASIAAMISILAGSYWVLFINQKKKADTDYAAIITEMDKDENMLRSNHIILTLPSNEKIATDSSNIVYDKEGASNIHAEQIAKPEDESKPQLNQLTVPYGKTASLTLSDGTKIWVNSGSNLIYPAVFANDKREIFVSGEIYLDVAKDENCPFIIKTNHIDVNVLGTKLNVSAYNNDSFQSVVLVSGSVAVKSNELKGDYEILPNQMLSYGISSKDVNIQKVDVNNHISWIQGYLLLKSESLDNVLQKLERHYNMTFSYDRNAIKSIKVSGKLNLGGGIEEVLNYISITAPIKYIISEKHIKIELKS
ncbi:FecR family protein [Prevotella sp. 10(H)]|uniref:FecR family protein n=1 Tax=Prevotella sp. 10(H) TaxID=1158294 RepID=UPI00068C4351|nr:FecR family protein [Prevotella sp. 10(H)]